MADFDYPYHTISDEYPESSSVIRFGNGYSFASKPKGPDQMLFHLNMIGFAWWVYSGATEIDRTVLPQINAAHLQDFYEARRMYTPFSYQHPTRGVVTVRFARPLPAFKSVRDAVIDRPDVNRRGHVIEPFQIDLILLP